MSCLQTDQETTYVNPSGDNFTDEGYQYYETYGTYPDAFSAERWRIDGTITLGTTCRYQCPGGGQAVGTVSAVTNSPFEETTVLRAFKPIWRRYFRLTCSINAGQGCP